MAELKIRPGVISKGMKLPVTIEEVINDVLVVSLEVGTRDFKGVLLDTKKRNLPHGICMPFSTNGDGTNDKGLVKSEHGAPEAEVSATTYRHSYTKPSNQSANKPVNIYPRTFKDKPFRNIRLRPRSTLCSKCKAVCHETEKGAVPVTQVIKQQNPKPTINLPQTHGSSIRENLRKRQYLQRSDVKDVVKDVVIDKMSAAVANTRASPFIKISIGEGTVLKIPPRLHDEVDGADSNTSQTEDNITNTADSADESEKIKKAKKSVRKLRDRERVKSTDVQENEVCSVSNTSSTVTGVASHHRKHKRKHKHRHSSSNSDKDKNTSSEKVDENGESQNTLSQTEVISQRPRLLYTWRQNKGLSPRRENTSNTFETFSATRGLSPKQHLSPRRNLSPKRRVYSMPNKQPVQSRPDMVAKKEYKLRSRERLSTESTESLVNDTNNSGSENDKYSLISSASDVEIESLKSGDEYSSTGMNEEDECEDIGKAPPSSDSSVDVFSLMMKIHTHDVPKCIATDGRTIHVGDIVWGKIKGFPWWPGRVLSISVSERENGTVIRKLAHVSWFGSSTMSHIQCSDLYPFLEDFKLRYNRKKRGPYKVAIKQATIAAQSITNTHHIDFSEFDL